MNYVVNTEIGHLAAKDAKGTRKSLKGRKENQIDLLKHLRFFGFNFCFNFLGIFSRLSRNFRVFRGRKLLPSSLRAASTL
jgi:hypothetical protein